MDSRRENGEEKSAVRRVQVSLSKGQAVSIEGLVRTVISSN